MTENDRKPPIWREDGKLDRSNNVAANDEKIETVSELPSALRDLKAVVAACRQMLGAPEDLPASDRAFSGLSAGIRALNATTPGTARIAQRIDDATQAANVSAAAGATLLSLSRRTGQHLLYSVAIHVGAELAKGSVLDEVGLEIFGAWCLRCLFDGYVPKNTAIAKVSAALIRPKTQIATAWSSKARARARTLALRSLDDTIRDHEQAAAELGLAIKTIRVVRSNLPVDVFNRKFRSRVENLIDFATHDAVAAAGGYDTLSASGLLDAGLSLVERVKTGDKAALLVCLEIITHLTSEMVLMLPFQIREDPPSGALAWFDVRGGYYFQTLFQLKERGARPEVGMEHLYEQTTQIVRIGISPPIHQSFLAEMKANGWVATNVHELLGDVGHHPNSQVVGSSAYRCTSRRLQQSVPTLLLDNGYHRWPVALATTSHFLVSRGRPSYGVCEARAIDAVTNAAYGLLGWPQIAGESDAGLVGSFTTPKPESVTKALNYLVDRVDAANADDFSGLIQVINRYAQWLAALLAFSLALRRWLRYTLPGVELRAGEVLHFDDKDVHARKGPPVPIPSLVRFAVTGWFELCGRAVEDLKKLGDRRSQDMALRIEERLRDISSAEAVFTINVVDQIEHIGFHTWVDVLPANIRLRPNFGRQFWPTRLMKIGVEQLLIDIFMRHQIDGLHPGSSHAVKKIYDSTVRLRACIDEVLESLALRVPKGIVGEG